MDKTQIAVEIFDRRAVEYQSKFMDVGLYSETFDLFCDAIKTENAAILDIACGPGNITQYLLNKRPDFQITGIDLAPNMIQLAKINNPSAKFQIMDCRDIGTIGKKYEGIMCGFCLPYLSKEECVKLIGDAAGLLTPGGALYISTMEDDYTKSGFVQSSSGEDKMYMHYHQADYLTQAFLDNGFSIIDLQRIDFPAQNGTTTIDLVMVGKR
ncbi:MAG: class I SAM-dependent methyltransferase [Bacteroidia bacterium]